MIALAHKNAGEYGLEDRVRYVNASGSRMPFEDGSFDAVFTNGSLHEWADPRATFNEIWRVLRAGGRYFISHSGFSVDASVRIPAFSDQAREALSQYIARPPLSLKKIGIEENRDATVISFTSQSEFFKGKTESFPMMRFFLELTQHIPPKGCQYIRRYGLYASRTKGKWADKPHVVRLAPAGWKKERLQASQDVQPYDAEAAYCVSDNESRSTWARLIAQVYEVDPLVCPRCSAPMRILAVITEPEEVRKILRHLVKIGRSPPGFDPTSSN